MKNIFKNSLFSASIKKVLLLFAVLLAAIITIGGGQTPPHSQKSDGEGAAVMGSGQVIPKGTPVRDIGGNQTVPRDLKTQSINSNALYHDYY